MLPLVSTLILGLFKLGGYLLVLGTYLNFVKDVRISLISKGCLLFFCQVYATTYHSLYHLLKTQNLFLFQNQLVLSSNFNSKWLRKCFFKKNVGLYTKMPIYNDFSFGILTNECSGFYDFKWSFSFFPSPEILNVK